MEIGVTGAVVYRVFTSVGAQENKKKSTTVSRNRGGHMLTHTHWGLAFRNSTVQYERWTVLLSGYGLILSQFPAISSGFICSSLSTHLVYTPSEYP